MNYGFIMLPSYYEALRTLPDEQRLSMFDAIFDYAFAGKEPHELPPILQGYFTLLRPNLDSSLRHYSSSVQNGKKGGRPKKNHREKPDKNPAETQAKPTENREKEKEREKDMEKDMDRAGAAAPPCSDSSTRSKPNRKSYGPYGWVKLSDEEHSRLSNELGETELKRCIAYVDESAQSTGNKNKWRDWNLVIRRCYRDGWGLKQPATKANKPYAYNPGDLSGSL